MAIKKSWMPTEISRRLWEEGEGDTHTNELIYEGMAYAAPGQEVEPEDSRRSVGRKIDGGKSYGAESFLYLVKEGAILQIDEEASDIAAQDLRDDVPSSDMSPTVNAYDSRADGPDSLERGETLEKDLNDCDARVEVPARCRGADQDGEENAHCITQADLEHR